MFYVNKMALDTRRLHHLNFSQWLKVRFALQWADNLQEQTLHLINLFEAWLAFEKQLTKSQYQLHLNPVTNNKVWITYTKEQ